MSVEELIKELKKLPKDMQVRYSIDKGRGHRTLCAINKVEKYYDTMVILSFKDR